VSEAERLARALAQELGCEEALALDGSATPSIPAERLRAAVLVCDRVLERLEDPLPVLGALRELLRDAPGAVIATPERELSAGDGGEVPARWSARELKELLESQGLGVEWTGLGRSTGESLNRSTLLVAVGGARGSEIRELLSTGARSLVFDDSSREGTSRNEGRPARICIASYEFVGPTRTGGIGTAYTSLAEALAEAGHEVTVLFTGWSDPDDRTPFSKWAGDYERKGIELAELRPDELPTIHSGHYNAQRSYLTYLWLKERDRERPYDVIHFPDTLGHGYFSLMAKSQGWAFGGTTLVTGVHSPSQWVLEANRAPFLTGQEFADDHIERAGVAMSDVVISPSAYLLDWTRSQGWELPDRVFVQQYVGSRATRREGADVDAGGSRPVDGPIEEIVFFGRLEVRKGLVLFCDALDLLAEEGALPGISIAFLGKQAPVRGAMAGDYLKERARRWPWEWRILDRLKQPEAVGYLKGDGGGRLAVMPSLADNTPNTVMEATALDIPFIASRAGGTAELIDPLDLARCSFDPGGSAGSSSLAAALRRAVEEPRFAPARAAVDPVANERVHVTWHERVAAATEAAAAEPAQEPVAGPSTPRVGICVVARHGKRLADLADSIEAQDYPAYEVVLAVDGDRNAALRRRVKELEPRFASRGWTVLHHGADDHDAARNLAARSAAGEYLLFWDEDAAAEPGQLSALVRVAQQSGADVVSCVAESLTARWPGLIVPEGGPPMSGLFHRCFATSVFLIRRDAFERIGGFDSRAEAASEDHEMLCRAALEGCSFQVIPEPLVREPLEGPRAIPVDHPEAGRAVQRTYEERAPQELEDLPGVARAHWMMARERAKVIDDLVGSRSWTVTKPLRWVGKVARRARGAERERSA
jgi:glycosyltransferase involved in cell wall biosynthesis